MIPVLHLRKWGVGRLRAKGESLRWRHPIRLAGEKATLVNRLTFRCPVANGMILWARQPCPGEVIRPGMEGVAGKGGKIPELMRM